jgi:hypothetical protein
MLSAFVDGETVWLTGIPSGIGKGPTATLPFIVKLNKAEPEPRTTVRIVSPRLTRSVNPEHSMLPTRNGAVGTNRPAAGAPVLTSNQWPFLGVKNRMS